MTDTQCSSCGGDCGKVCERENVVEPYNGWVLRNVYFEDGEPLMHSEPENTQAQELFGKTEQLEAEIKRLQEREWVGLTDEELNEHARWADEHGGTFYIAYARSIEAKLKEQQMILNAQGCAECGKGDGYALFCGACHDEFRVWVGLTDEDIEELRCHGAHSVSDKDFRAIETWLKEKNT